MREGKKKRYILRGVRIAAILLFVAALALVNVFYPFRSLLPAYALPGREEGELRIHFLYTGQGDATIVEFPEGDVLVVDAGDGDFGNENNLVRYLKALAPESIALLATHADIDHTGGFEELIRFFGADTVYLPVVPSETLRYTRFAEAAQSSGAEICTLSRYDVIEKPSGAYLACISPYEIDETDANDSSTVLYLCYEGVSALLCGDISSAREGRLLREYALYEGIFDCGDYRVRLEETDILKVAHHGSSSSSSEEFLSLLSPGIAVISSGRGNAYSHPASEAVARLSGAGAEIYRTDELGNLIVGISGGSYYVKTHITN